MRRKGDDRQGVPSTAVLCKPPVCEHMLWGVPSERTSKACLKPPAHIRLGCSAARCMPAHALAVWRSVGGHLSEGQSQHALCPFVAYGIKLRRGVSEELSLWAHGTELRKAGLTASNCKTEKQSVDHRVRTPHLLLRQWGRVC